MAKIYGFVWHDVVCRGFETEGKNELAAATIMHAMVQKEALSCDDEKCEHTLIVTDELTPKMIMGGMTSNMIRVQTPESKRELVLRVLSVLQRFTAEQTDKALSEFPPVVKRFLNDIKCMRKPSTEEVQRFDLGSDFVGFLNKARPRIQKVLGKKASIIDIRSRARK